MTLRKLEGGFDAAPDGADIYERMGPSSLAARINLIFVICSTSVLKPLTDPPLVNQYERAASPGGPSMFGRTERRKERQGGSRSAFP